MSDRRVGPEMYLGVAEGVSCPRCGSPGDSLPSLEVVWKDPACADGTCRAKTPEESDIASEFGWDDVGYQDGWFEADGTVEVVNAMAAEIERLRERAVPEGCLRKLAAYRFALSEKMGGFGDLDVIVYEATEDGVKQAIKILGLEDAIAAAEAAEGGDDE